MAGPRVSIIILNYNGRRFLRECFDSVLKQRCEGGFEIVVVDNASSDGSAEYVRKTWRAELAQERIRLVALDKNTGFTGGNNIGIRHASKSSRIIVLLNNDVRVERDWLPELLKPLDDPHVAIAGCNNISPQYEGDYDYWYARRGVCEGMSLCGAVVLRKMTREERKAQLPQPFIIGGVCMAFRKREIPEPFDEDYFAYAEDVALCWEMRMRGRAIALNPKSRMLHYCGGAKNSSERMNKFATFHGTKNQFMNFLLFYEVENIVRIAPLFAAWQLGVFISQPSLMTSRLRSYWWVLTHARLIRRKRREMQARRKVPDREIIRQLDAALIDELQVGRAKGARRLIITSINSSARLYARIVGMRIRQ